MTIEELKSFLEENKDNADVKNVLASYVETKEVEKPLTEEAVDTWLSTADGKKFLQPILDKNFTKGIETYKAKTLPGLVEDEISKRYPPETDDQKELKQLKMDLEYLKKEKQREELKSIAISIMNKNGLPLELTKFIVGESEEVISDNVNTLKTVLASSIKTEVDKKFKEYSTTPKKSDDNSDPTVNPWKPETFNYTDQIRIMKENPELAKKLQQGV